MIVLQGRQGPGKFDTVILSVKAGHLAPDHVRDHPRRPRRASRPPSASSSPWRSPPNPCVAEAADGRLPRIQAPGPEIPRAPAADGRRAP
ncbi:MAG: hypothetical protein M0C28_02895 [Candidatus Moduliflexus flocculans]|nr:hypothetical protein [Candidatus Moduliflexus flocculans]